MQLNFSRGALFHMKTRVSLRYFVTDCGSTLCPHYQPHCKLPFAFNLKNLLQFLYPVTYMTEIRELQKICFFPFFWIIVIGILGHWCCIIFNLAMWILIANQGLIKLRKNLLIMFSKNSFSPLNGWNKSNTRWANFSKEKGLFETLYQRVDLTLRHRIVYLEIIN